MESAPQHSLPDLYARWLRSIVHTEPPVEPLSTCDDCAMCVKDSGELPTSLHVFTPDIKCCVYMPRLPNFLVGQILATAEDDPGRVSVEARIDGVVAVTPLGLDRPPSYDLLFRNSADGIGKSKTLRCPHFIEDGGLCGIYRHRDSTCSTWFCRHERGRLGAQFWRALRQLLSTVERQLSVWCALEVGARADQLAPLIAASPDEEFVTPQKPSGLELEGKVPERERQARWGEWLGEERAFYTACAQTVEALNWEEVAAVCGPDLRVRAAELARRHAELEAPFTLPRRLTTAQFSVGGMRQDGLRAVTYSSLNAIDLPTPLVAVLPQFDGRASQEILDDLETNHRVKLQPEFLRQLVDWGVLIDPERPLEDDIV